MANKNKKMTKTADQSGGNTAPGSRFEKIFYRYLAWFPILVLPVLVVEMLQAGDYAVAGIIGVMHAVLVFRFVQVVNVGGWFRFKKKVPEA